MDVTVSVLTADDWEVWRDVRLRALGESPEAFGSSLDREQGFSEDQWRERASGKNGPALVARTDEGEVVGCGGGYYDGNEFHVVAMWTDPAFRGHGVGRALLRAVVALAPGGSERVHLCVLEGNGSAQRFYEREGFQVTGKCSPLGRDPSVQKVYMAREVQPHAV